MEGGCHSGFPESYSEEVAQVNARLRTDDEAMQRDVRRLVARIARMATQARWLAAESRDGEYLRVWLVNEQAQEVATIADRAKRRYEQRKAGQ